MIQELVNLQNVYANSLFPDIFTENELIKSRLIQHTKTMKQPKLGDRKEVVRFAFLPILVESRFVWMKRYKLVKQYNSWQEYDSMLNDSYPVEEWVTVERKLMRR